MSITRFNNESVKFNFEPSKDFKYYNLEDLFKGNGAGEEYVVKGLFISTKGLYGESPIAVLEDCFVNLPNHLLNVVKEIRQDEKLVDDINNDKVGFKIYTYYQEKYRKQCYSINWIEF